MTSNLLRKTSMTAAAVAMLAVMGAAAGTPALAQSTTVTPAPVVIALGSSALIGVNVTSNLYNLPNAYVEGQITAGQTWFAVGRDTTGTWTEIQIDPTNFGWAPTSVFAIGNIQLPVIANVTGAPVAVAVSAPTAASNAPVVVAAGSSVLIGVNTTTNVYDLPNANVVGLLTAGQTWFVVGRDTTGKWTEVQIDPATFGWVSTSALGIGSIQLPVVPGVTGS